MTVLSGRDESGMQKQRPCLRADIADLEAYHSPQIDGVVRLNTNESPYPPPQGFLDAWHEALTALPLHRYPDRSSAVLRQGLGEFLQQPAERVFCANGSNEVLQTLLLAYGGAGRKALTFEPSYVLHAQIGRVTGTTMITVDRREDFTLDPDDARRAVEREAPDIVFLTSPNNPTGMVEPPEVLEAVLAAAPGLVVVDEAYADFAPWSPLDLVDDDLSLVVVRTYSKVWSMAALRLGYCVGPAWLVADLSKVVLPYHLSAPVQIAGTLALQWQSEMAARVEIIVSERERIAAGLGGINGLKAFSSGANFLLFRPPGDAHAAWQALLERGVLVRDFSGRPGLAGCLRVTVGTPEENSMFLAALHDVCTVTKEA